MSIQRQFERDEEALERQLANGEITQREFDMEMRELNQEYRAAAEEAIRQAGERERENW